MPHFAQVRLWENVAIEQIAPGKPSMRSLKYEAFRRHTTPVIPHVRTRGRHFIRGDEMHLLRDYSSASAFRGAIDADIDTVVVRKNND